MAPMSHIYSYHLAFFYVLHPPFKRQNAHFKSDSEHKSENSKHKTQSQNMEVTSYKDRTQNILMHEPVCNILFCVKGVIKDTKESEVKQEKVFSVFFLFFFCFFFYLFLYIAL